jgi:cytochrome c peroxidase
VFLTTRSPEALAPILAGYNQVVDPDYNEKGEIVGAFSHMLRVFLIDKQKRIRNIYSVSFLHPDILINDVRTLLLEDGAERTGTADTASRGGAVVQDARRGSAVDLMAVLRRPPLGLPPVPVPADNPVTRDKVALGRKLFFDRRLSLNNTISCAMCHVPEQGFTSNARALAVGIEGRTVRRNAPTLYNTAYLRRLFHDGREYSLEHQVWTPLLTENMMGNRSFAVVINKIRRLPDYDGLFAAAFAGKGPGMETIGQALASYERVLVSGDSPFDRWYYGKNPQALGAAAQRGFALFTGKAGCASCHLVGRNSALFTDSAMHNTGLGWYNAMARPTPSTRVEVSPGVYLDIDTTIIDTVSGERPGDTGLYEVTQDPADRWRYRTPSLRNIALTAPYMHDGSLQTLREVVEFYNRGGYPNVALDALIKPLDLAPAEIDDLVVFLQSLTGHDVPALVADALAAPVGDVHDRDPGPAPDHLAHDKPMRDKKDGS